MGADCHALLQNKVKDRWVSVKEVEIYRNYALFGCLAGVRGRAKKIIAYNRGFPLDFEESLCNNKDVKLPDGEYMWIGEHSFTWLTLEELQKYPWSKINIEEGYEVLPESLKELLVYCNNLKNWRLILGFDS